MSLQERLEGLLAEGKDGAPLRVSLALACMGHGNAAEAINHLKRAVALDSGYSAAWKTYGRALAMEGKNVQARAAYQRGLEVARAAGDRQAEREMQVFLNRLEKQART
ncbi:MAG: tetratricopeptide repeat protein [Gammaproteobacteria bacterium]